MSPDTPRHRRRKTDHRQLHLLDRPDGRTSIVLASGFILDLKAPDATGMPIEDIAKALASQPRWGGACSPWYSVAEHSIMASYLVPAAHAFDALMHDSHEFLGDWPTPVKEMVGRETLNQLVVPIERALARRFGFRLGVASVKRADQVCMATELRDLLPPHWMDWGHLPQPHPDRIEPVGPSLAYDLFMQRFAALNTG